MDEPKTEEQVAKNINDQDASQTEEYVPEDIPNSHIEEDLELLFPHDSMRKGQDQLVEDIKEALTNRKVILAHAPTGLGKTASALSVAVPLAKRDKKKVFFLTNRHTQHKIAIDTLKDIRKKHGINLTCADLIGKKTMCNQETANLFGNEFNEFCKTLVEKGNCGYYSKVKDKKGSKTVEAKYLLDKIKAAGPLHNEELQVMAIKEDMCSYEMAVELAKKADVFIGDYYYLFNPNVRQALLKKLDISYEDIILILDEAHNVPNRISDMLSESLTTNMIRNAANEATKMYADELYTKLTNLHETMNKMAVFKSDNKFASKEKRIEKQAFIRNINAIADYDEFIEELEDVAEKTIKAGAKRSYCSGIAWFLEMWKGDSIGFSRILKEVQGKISNYIELEYACLDPSIVAKEVLDGICGAVIMSGTLNPLRMYADLLGTPEATLKKYPSPFPIQNRRSIIIPETSTKYNMRSDKMYEKIAYNCSKIIKATPGNIALFFPSYKLRDDIANKVLTTKKVFVEQRNMSKEEKEVFLNDYKSYASTGAVLYGVTGANFAEGVDFPGNLLMGVIIIGIPLARPDLKTQDTIEYYDQKFKRGWDYAYTFPAINKCIQSAGRCIRSETDRGIIIYLDERFSWQKYHSCLPREGLMVSRQADVLVTKFFNNNNKNNNQ